MPKRKVRYDKFISLKISTQLLRRVDAFCNKNQYTRGEFIRKACSRILDWKE